MTTGINAHNHQNRRYSKPRTCVIPQLYEFAEKHGVLLGRSVVPLTLFHPAETLQKECPNAPPLLMLGDRATRRVQLDMLLRMEGYFHAKRILGETQGEAGGATDSQEGQDLARDLELKVS